MAQKYSFVYLKILNESKRKKRKMLLEMAGAERKKNGTHREIISGCPTLSS